VGAANKDGILVAKVYTIGEGREINRISPAPGVEQITGGIEIMRLPEKTYIMIIVWKIISHQIE